MGDIPDLLHPGTGLTPAQTSDRATSVTKNA
jgi:hypothetical protein